MASSGTRLLENGFQFILCEGCRQESPNLKLLSCLHTLCLGCLSENKCPVCQTSISQVNGIPRIDNLLFTNLRVRLKVYEKIVDGVNLSCDNCKKGVEFWCPECEEFLCAKCFEAHQHYLKKERHEPKRVMDIRAGSAKDFLEGTRRTGNLSCSNLTHKSQTVGIYCKKCEKALCCICTVLDSQHAPFCDICGETQRRQEELATINQELRQKRSILEATFMSLQDEAAQLKEAQREMQELIRQRVEQLVELLRREEEELLGLVEARQEQGHRELAGELQRVGGLLQRLEAGERLVETMNLYATEQEVMDMQPFIKGSLEELQRLEPLAVAGDRAQPRDMAECRARLQALVERVTGKAECGVPPSGEEHGESCEREPRHVLKDTGAPLPVTGTLTPQHNFPSEDETTMILNLEPPGEGHQPREGLPTGLLARHQLCRPMLDPSDGRGHVCPDQGGEKSPMQPTPPAFLTQRDEEAKEALGSSHGDTVPLPRSIQDSLASLQEDFGGWARSNVQQADELLEVGNRLLQAQYRANRRLILVTQEIQAMSHSLATIASAVGPLLQPAASSQDFHPADMNWPSLPSDLLELFPSSTSQIPGASTAPSWSRTPPVTLPGSPACSEPSSSPSEGEYPKPRHSTKGKHGGKPSTRLRKRRKK